MNETMIEEETTDKEWLSLSEAAQLLGVHPGTIRLWSDKGVLPTYKTQGGHRRYRRAEILLRAKENGAPREPAEENLLPDIIQAVRAQISDARLETQSWYRKLDEEARAQYRMSGRSLFQGLMAYIAAEEEKDAAAEAYAIGYEYASRARRYNLDYVDATQAFLCFRDALVTSFVKIYGEAKAPADRVARAYLKIHAFTDEILVSLLKTYRSLENANR